MEMELLQAQIKGLRTSLAEAREKEKIFIKAQTLAEQVDKARVAADKITDSLEGVKKVKADLKQQKADFLESALDPLAAAITALLPYGEAVVTLEDHLFVGWKFKDDKGAERMPYFTGLSGGQKPIFEAALSNAVLAGDGQKIIIIEGGETDVGKVRETLLKIRESHPEAQVIMSIWYPIADSEIPEGWRVVRL